jgi:hypothetical protein
MQVTSRPQDGREPFETRFRVEFHDEPDATLLHRQAVATDAEV